MITRPGKSTISRQRKGKCVAKFRKRLCFGVKVQIKLPTLADTIVSNKGRYYGAGDRTRTGTLSPAVDFESTTSTIPSHRQVCFLYSNHQPPLAIFYCGRHWRRDVATVCGARCAPWRNACVAHRPQHLLHPRWIRRRRRSGSQRWICVHYGYFFLTLAGVPR